MSQMPIIYIDVDDTIVRSFGSKRIPIVETISKIKELHSMGFEMYCWSSGGAEYSKSICQEFEIANCFKAFLPKPNLMVDDQEVNNWRFLSEILPHNFSLLSKDDLIANLKKRMNGG